MSSKRDRRMKIDTRVQVLKTRRGKEANMLVKDRRGFHFDYDNNKSDN
jgi:hypothetical protein